jgi:hypothetical protein
MAQNLYPDLIFPQLSATILLLLYVADGCADELTGFSLKTVIYRDGSRMDQWLHDGSALTYVKDVNAWVVVNKWGKPMAWTDDRAEIAWLSLWVLEYKAISNEAMSHTTKPLSSSSGSRSSVRDWRSERPSLFTAKPHI